MEVRALVSSSDWKQTAQYALTGSVIASALDGITYGFTSAEDETPDAARRRMFLIRIGHAAIERPDRIDRVERVSRRERIGRPERIGRR